MQMKRRALALVTAVIMALALIPGVSFASPFSDAMQAAVDALVIPNADNIRGSINLPSVGENGAAISWTSSNEAVVSTKEIENEGYLPAPAGVVTRGSEDVVVTLVADITLDGEYARKTFDLTVKALPGGDVSLMEADDSDSGAYLFYYFIGNAKVQQQIFLAASKDGLKWEELHDSYPILISTMGDRAVRDPYIIRSPEGDRFFLIATDLDAGGNNWTEYQYNGSKYMMVWESDDLVHWSDQRMVLASTLPEQGCTWAPEAIYDPETKEYVVYWSSKMTDKNNPRYGMQSVYYATTRDFYTFSEPKMFIAGKLGQTGAAGDPNENIPVIDTTILQSEDDGKFYRVTKHELVSRVFIESSDHLLGDYTTVASNVYNDFSGVEGPELYRLKDGRYSLILDNFGLGGYYPVVTDDLAGGQFKRLDSSEYAFPSSAKPRHGGIIKISDEEYDRVMNFYTQNAEVKEADPAGTGPIITYNFNDGTAKDSTGNNDGLIVGNASVVDDAIKGKVLSLAGGEAYLALPAGVLDGRNELTVSMDLLNNTTGNFFTFAIGQSNNRYLYMRARGNGNPNGAYVGITKSSWKNEEGVTAAGAITDGEWTNVTFTISAADHSIKLYVDGNLAAENNNVTLTIADLLSGTSAYIGKSFYTDDGYANMKVDNIKIFNRVLNDNEIEDLTKYDPYENQRYSIAVDADKKGVDIADGMFGLFFEDINYAGDGGLYSEVINNRSFEAYDASVNKVNPTAIPGYGWSAVGGASLNFNSAAPLNANNPTYLTLTAASAGDGVINDCYSGDGTGNKPLAPGLAAELGETFNASLYARGTAELKVQVVDTNGNVLGETAFTVDSDEFTKLEGVLEITEGASDDARVQVVLAAPGSVDLDMISLIPQETFNGRDNGLRADLVELLAEIEPGFLRFPGGCIIEGFNLANRYQWKHTVGPVEQRVQNWNRWQTHDDFHAGNGMYGYCQTYGLGFYEYFLLCEDIGAKAVPVVNVGLACQYQSGEASSWDDLKNIYIPDALDLIEFANGDPVDGWEDIDYSAVNTNDPSTFGDNWANLRALMGHPESFELEYIGIGNEQWNTSANRFFERYEAFESAIHELYPDMKLISTSGPSADGTDFNNAWNWLNTHSGNGESNFTYAVDEHYYRNPQWFYDNIDRYNTYDRNGYSVFAGEYACRWSVWDGAEYPYGNTVETAVAEAAFMTSLERNADVVKMASYAPLFAKEGSIQWTPDMIWFNNKTAFGSADYYVQKLFSVHTGNYTVSDEVLDKSDESDYTGIAGVGTWLTSASFRDFKVVDNETGEEIAINGWQNGTSGTFYSSGDWVIGSDGSVTQNRTDTQGAQAYLFADMEPINSNNYTITVKATKTGGAEGFIIPVMAKNQSNLIHWNVGGWGNTMSAFEKRTNGSNGAVSAYAGTVLETNREYEVKIIVKDGSIAGYLDGKLVNTYTFDATTGPVYSSSSFDEETGDIIIKVVNSSNNDQVVPITVSYSGGLSGTATEYLINGGENSKKNDFNDPERVSMAVREIGAGESFEYYIPANSVAALRVHTGANKGVKEAEELRLSFKKGSAPVLPGEVEVTYFDGTTANKAVSWNIPAAGTFANPGTFKVYGDVEGTEVRAIAYITITDEDMDIIVYNSEELLSGQSTVVSFYPTEAGKYKGIFAVYNGDILESASAVDFNGIGGSLEVKLPEGRTAKIMLWTGDELAPVTEAVKVGK